MWLVTDFYQMCNIMIGETTSMQTSYFVNAMLNAYLQQQEKITARLCKVGTTWTPYSTIHVVGEHFLYPFLNQLMGGGGWTFTICSCPKNLIRTERRTHTGKNILVPTKKHPMGIFNRLNLLKYQNIPSYYVNCWLPKNGSTHTSLGASKLVI